MISAITVINLVIKILSTLTPVHPSAEINCPMRPPTGDDYRPRLFDLAI
jgi:hypothetical protein